MGFREVNEGRVEDQDLAHEMAKIEEPFRSAAKAVERQGEIEAENFRGRRAKESKENYPVVEEEDNGDLFVVSLGSERDAAEMVIRICLELDSSYFRGMRGVEMLQDPIGKLLARGSEEHRPDSSYAVYVHRPYEEGDKYKVIADLRNSRGQDKYRQVVREAVHRAMESFGEEIRIPGREDPIVING